MQQILSSKTITVIGSTGYVGQNICRQASQFGMRVNGVSRRGLPPGLDQYWHKNVNWIRGDAMQPESFSSTLQQSDLIVHTIGTLFDTTITKRRSPGDAGTYEQMNRDSLISIAKQIEGTKATIVYLSASSHPPYVHRYLQTKVEAEEYLLQKHSEGLLNPVILKPGFIYSWSDRWWSVPLKVEIDLWRKFYSFADCIVPKQSLIGGFWKEFKLDSSVKLQDLTFAAIYSGVDSNLIGKRLDNHAIEEAANHFRSQLLPQSAK